MIYSYLVIGVAVLLLVVFLFNFKKNTIRVFRQLAKTTNGKLQVPGSENAFEKAYSQISPAVKAEVSFVWKGRNFNVSAHDNYLSINSTPIQSIEIASRLNKALGVISIQGGKILSQSKHAICLEKTLSAVKFKSICSKLSKKFGFNKKYQAMFGPRGDIIIENDKIFIYKNMTMKEQKIEVLLEIVEDLNKLSGLFDKCSDSVAS